MSGRETCDEIKPLLSALVDGELGPEKAARVSAHLEECAECRRARDELARLVELLRAAPPLEPPPALWTRIEAEATREAARPRGLVRHIFRRWWWPALGLAGSALAIALVALPPRPRPALAGPSDDVLLAEARAELGKAEEHYLRAIADLRRYTERERSGWPIERRREFDAALAALEAATERCRAAVRHDPADPDAEELLHRAYRQQIAFLEEWLLRRGEGAPPSAMPGVPPGVEIRP